MQKRFYLLLYFVSVFLGIQAQSLVLKNRNTGKTITNDTIVVQSTDNGGWVGAESLDMLINVVNPSGSKLEVGAKKIEYETMQTDVKHTICFAGQCYDVGTFDSPTHAEITAGTSDSSFLAHYLFDNTVHKRGINHVAYMFYDVKNTSNAAIVYVTYNTVVTVSAPAFIKNSATVFPNPAKDILTIVNLPNVSTNIALYNLLGNKLMQVKTSGEKAYSMPVCDLTKGVYFLDVAGQRLKVLKD